MHFFREKLMFSDAESFGIAMADTDIKFWHTARSINKMSLVLAMIPNGV